MFGHCVPSPASSKMASVFHYVYGLLFRPRPRLVVQTVTDEGVIQKADETVITAHPRTNTPMEAPEEENAEEGLKMYAKGGFHPVRLREVYHGKYEVLRKIGYGRYSTVWLVKNQEFVAATAGPGNCLD